jgi:hypothetical protein
MDFCVISPIRGLKDYGTLTNRHLVLQHIMDQEYCEFYRERRKQGDHIILDNGAYEGAPIPNVDAYALAIEYFQPTITVLPDFLLKNWKRTLYAARFYLDELWDAFQHKTEFLFIPQAEPRDASGFMQGYLEMVEDSRISHIGIPRALAYAITDNPLARVELAKLIKRDHPSLGVHCFGMVDGLHHELHYLAEAGVASVDSSAPVWRGWCGYRIDDKEDRREWTKLAYPVNFLTTVMPTSIQQAIIRHNLEVCGVRTVSDDPASLG